MSDPVIRASSLVKKYDDFVAVDGISFEVERGESFGLLGPNGAGKSTTMKMIAAVSTPTSGELTVLGLDPRVDGPRFDRSSVSSPRKITSTRNSASAKTC